MLEKLCRNRLTVGKFRAIICSRKVHQKTSEGMYTPKDYEIVKIEIIRDNGETIVGIQIGKNSIMEAVKNKFGTDMTVYQIKNSERFVISAIRGESFQEEVSINVIPTNCYAKFNQDCREWLVWGKHSGRYGKTTFVEFMERFKKLP